MKIQENLTMWKRWGVAFVIGGILGMILQKEISIQIMRKDCEILGGFRIGNIAYSCKPVFSK